MFSFLLKCIFIQKKKQVERWRSDERRERFVIKFSKTIQISNSLFNDTSKQSNSGAHLSCVSLLLYCALHALQWEMKAHGAVISSDKHSQKYIKCVYGIVKFPEDIFPDYKTAGNEKHTSEL